MKIRLYRNLKGVETTLEVSPPFHINENTMHAYQVAEQLNLWVKNKYPGFEINDKVDSNPP